VLKPREAAERLYAFASMKLQSGQGADLGVKGNPSATVQAFQKAMRRITADGFYGPETRARGKELLGRDFPIRRRVAPSQQLPPEPPPPPAPPAPAPPSPTTPSPAQTQRAAAESLLAYVQALGTRGRAKALGYRAHPNATVRDAQRAMGELTADGIYGPATRRRGKALTGKTFPPR